MTLHRTFIIALAAASLAPVAASAQDGWPLFRGNAQRTGAGATLPAREKRPAWQRPLLLDKLDKIVGFADDLEGDPDGPAKTHIEKLRKGADPTILPGFFPLVVNDFCLYRTFRDVRCVTMDKLVIAKGDFNPEFTLKPGAIVWKSVSSSSSLSKSAEEDRLRPGLQSLTALLQKSGQSQWLWANPMIGVLSADDEFVYAIHDIPIPAVNPKAGGLNIHAFWKPFVKSNVLIACNVGHGKLSWDINALGGAVLPEFTDSFFLGAPLPFDKKIFLLNEKAGEVRLMLLDRVAKADAKGAWSPTLEKKLTLVKVPDAERVPTDLLRRTQPLQIAHADGLLVCPTHAGVLVGVDRAKMAVRWQYRYRDDKAALPLLPHWQAACPIIHKDRIVFTAADAPEIHCLDLDGTKKWSAPRETSDLYLATVTDDLVLFVGKSHCRALSLADGREKWKLEMGLPAGVGVKDGSLYYVPLKIDAVTKGPTIQAIDLIKGKKARRVEVPHPDALGNLALHRGMLVSQSVTHVAAFPLGTK